MFVRSHPVVDLRLLDEPPELRIAHHILRIQQQPVRQIPRQHGRIRPAQQNLPTPTINPVGTDYKVRPPPRPILQHRNRNRPPLSPLLKLHIHDLAINLEPRPQLQRPRQQLAMQVGAVEVPKRGPELRGVRVEVHVRDARALPVVVVALPGPRRVGRELALHAPSEEHARRVGQDLDACADFADLGCGLEDGDCVAGEEGGDGGTEAAEAGADYEDLGGVVRMGGLEWLLGVGRRTWSLVPGGRCCCWITVGGDGPIVMTLQAQVYDLSLSLYRDTALCSCRVSNRQHRTLSLNLCSSYKSTWKTQPDMNTNEARTTTTKQRQKVYKLGRMYLGIL